MASPEAGPYTMLSMQDQPNEEQGPRWYTEQGKASSTALYT